MNIPNTVSIHNIGFHSLPVGCRWEGRTEGPPHDGVPSPKRDSSVGTHHHMHVNSTFSHHAVLGPSAVVCIASQTSHTANCRVHF